MSARSKEAGVCNYFTDCCSTTFKAIKILVYVLWSFSVVIVKVCPHLLLETDSVANVLLQFFLNVSVLLCIFRAHLAD